MRINLNQMLEKRNVGPWILCAEIENYEKSKHIKSIGLKPATFKRILKGTTTSASYETWERINEVVTIIPEIPAPQRERCMVTESMSQELAEALRVRNINTLALSNKVQSYEKTHELESAGLTKPMLNRILYGYQKSIGTEAWARLRTVLTTIPEVPEVERKLSPHEASGLQVLRKIKHTELMQPGK